mgnify:CR=1 FL=1
MPNQGYTKLFENLLNHSNIELRLNSEFKNDVQIRDDKFYFENKEFLGKIIYTGMIDELFEYKFEDLPYRSVDMEFEIINKYNKNKIYKYK